MKAKVMVEKRIKHQRIIVKQKELDAAAPQAPSFDQLKSTPAAVEANEDELQDTFSTVIAQKKRTSQKPFDVSKAKRKRVARQSTKDEANYINYASKDHLTETGYISCYVSLCSIHLSIDRKPIKLHRRVYFFNRKDCNLSP